MWDCLKRQSGEFQFKFTQHEVVCILRCWCFAMDTPAFMNPFAVTYLSVLLLYLILQITVCLVMAKGFQAWKKRMKKYKSQSSYLNFGEPAVCSPGGASASSSPHHCLQPPPAPAGKWQGIMGRRFGENPAWIAIVGCTVLNFSPYPFLLHNFKAMHGKVFFRKLIILVFFQFPDLDTPRLQSFPSQRDGIILRDLNYLLN